MDLLSIILLSAVEGVTEFLPISSTAHLILTSNIINLKQTNFLTTFQISIQSGAILAVLSLYFQTIKKNPKIIFLLLISFVPIAIIGLLFFNSITSLFFNSNVIIIGAMLIGGIALIASEALIKDKDAQITNIKQITPKLAFFIGIAQCFSLIPGTSRAAASIIGGLVFGLNKKTAVEYSFLLGLPTITGATALDLIKNASFISQVELKSLLLGSIFSFLFAYLAVKIFLKLLDNHALTYFGLYRIILAGILMFWLI